MKFPSTLGAVVFICTTLASNSLSGSSSELNSEAEEVYAVIRISSSPSGALVMLSNQAEFDEMTAPVLGKTPIMRRMQISTGGSVIHITKPGYEEWVGRISAETPQIKADMVLLPNTDLNRSTRSKFNKVTVIPARIGIRKVWNPKSGEELPDFEVSELATGFRRNFMHSLGERLRGRFSENIAVKNSPELETDEFWLQVEDILTGIRPDKIGFYPEPVSIEFGTHYSDILSSIGDGVLLIRSEAYYHTKGHTSGLVIGAILMTLAAREAAKQNAKTGANPGETVMYSYPVYSVGPSNESIIVQQLLIDSETKELVWFSQTVLPGNFSREGVTETLASKIGSQFPSAFLFKPND